MGHIPALSLNCGISIPQLGFGVFEIEPDATKRVVLDALEVGFRHIDTAAAYGNEHGVGQAVAESGIPRAELFITTKQRPTDQAAAKADDAIHRSLDRLGLAFVDLYLIHWPMPRHGLYVESWHALEQFRAEGLTRAIGVSNFLPEHIETLIAGSTVVPALNQFESHPRLQQRDIQICCRRYGIQVEAWSPLARGALVKTPALCAIAERHSKTIAQVMLRWQVQQGHVIIPRTTKKTRMLENIDLFDFALSDEEMRAIGDLENGARIGRHPAEKN